MKKLKIFGYYFAIIPKSEFKILRRIVNELNESSNKLIEAERKDQKNVSTGSN